jgi:hypothetical protein
MPEFLPAGPINEDNFFEWEAYIKGPDETPFEGGIFCAKLTFPKDYPLNPPKVCRLRSCFNRMFAERNLYRCALTRYVASFRYKALSPRLTRRTISQLCIQIVSGSTQKEVYHTDGKLLQFMRMGMSAYRSYTRQAMTRTCTNQAQNAGRLCRMSTLSCLVC